jgi:DNA-binding NarL/FixJ family response regulator
LFIGQYAYVFKVAASSEQGSKIIRMYSRYDAMTIRVILADDQQMILDALSTFLNNENDIEVVGAATDGRSVQELFGALQPDVAVMGVGLLGMNGIDATRCLVAEHPQARVVALSDFARRQSVLDMLEAGAHAYVIKENPVSELVDALHAVMKGQKYLCMDVVDVVANHADQNPIEISRLGQREREVLQLLAEGGTSLVIAKRLSISTCTVDVHRRNIMKKLDLHTAAELTKYAVRNGLTYI